MKADIKCLPYWEGESQDCYHGNLRGPCSGLPKKGGHSSRISGLWELGAQLRKELGLYAWTIFLAYLQLQVESYSLRSCNAPT